MTEHETNFSSKISEYSKNEVTPQRKYRTVGLVMFLVASALCLARITINNLGITSEWTADVVFTLFVQIGCLLIMPFLIYKFALKMTVKQTLSFSNFHKTKWFNIALMIPLGICVYFVQWGVSSVWQVFIALLGYTHSAASPLPENFSIWFMLANIVTTAVLPAVCEEFTCRGGFLTTMRKSFAFMPTIIICAIQFGLFHQNITQVFYTAVFGGFVAFLTIKTNSIYPAMIIHFMNNGLSVYFDFAQTYKFFGGGLNDYIFTTLQQSPYIIFAAMLGFSVCLLAISYLIIKLNKPKNTTPQITSIEKPLYAPHLMDNVFIVGAIVTAVLSTVFTFAFGLLK